MQHLTPVRLKRATSIVEKGEVVTRVVDSLALIDSSHQIVFVHELTKPLAYPTPISHGTLTPDTCNSLVKLCLTMPYSCLINLSTYTFLTHGRHQPECLALEPTKTLQEILTCKHNLISILTGGKGLTDAICSGLVECSIHDVLTDSYRLKLVSSTGFGINVIVCHYGTGLPNLGPNLPSISDMHNLP